MYASAPYKLNCVSQKGEPEIRFIIWDYAKTGPGACGCGQAETCSVREIWQRVTDATLDILEGTSLADLARREAEMNPELAHTYQMRQSGPESRQADGDQGD